MKRLHPYLVLLVGGLYACGDGRPPSPDIKAAAPAGVVDSPTPGTTPQQNAPTPSAEQASSMPAADNPSPDSPPREPPLTAEEIRLIEADVATLTVEERRARAFALRRKILQNPESPAAKSLESLRKAVESGEIVPPSPESLRRNAPASDAQGQ